MNNEVILEANVVTDDEIEMLASAYDELDSQKYSSTCCR